MNSSMHTHFRTHTLRSIAIAMLMVWLFTVTAGVANACLLKTPELPAGALNVVVLVHAHQQGAGPGDESKAAKQSCLKTCDDGTKALPKAQAGADQTDPGPAPLVTTLRAVSTKPVLASRQFDELQVRLVGPPLRVRYSRLAL